MFAEAWRLGRRCVFWWQARHLQPQLRFAWPAGRFQYEQRCLRKRGPGTPPRFVVPGVILAATQPRFAWPAWHFQYEHRCLRKRGAWDAAAFSGSRRDTCSTSASFCVLAWRCPYEHRCLRKRGAWDAAAFSTQHNTTHTYNFQHLRLDLRGRRSTFSTSIDVCGSLAPGTPRRFLVAGAISVRV